jgi:hypothetical protein
VRSFDQALEASGAPVLIYSDAGTPTPQMTQFLKIKDPKNTVCHSACFCWFGVGIAGKGGGLGCRPDPTRRPIGMFGDGSCGISMAELETASAHHFNLIPTTANLADSKVCTGAKVTTSISVSILCRQMAKQLPWHLGKRHGRQKKRRAV